MSQRQIDQPPEDDEVIVLQYHTIDRANNEIRVDLRVRGDNNWLYYKDIRLGLGWSFTLKDGQGDASDPPASLVN